MKDEEGRPREAEEVEPEGDDGEEEGDESEEEAATEPGGLCPYRIEYHQWTPEQLQAYLDDRAPTYPDGTPAADDYWDYNADHGLLRRHHILRRDSLFGHQEADQPAWAVCGLRRSEIQEARRTVIIGPDGQLTCIYDNWAVPGDQAPEVSQRPWWGFTDFARHGTVHLGRPPQDHEEPYYIPNEGGAEDEGLEEAEEEEEEVASTTETPGSEASTLRSRTPPGDERRVGYLEASPRLERLLEAEVKRQVRPEAGDVEEAARHYVEHCTSGAPYGPHLVREAVKLGDRLLLATGSLELAMEELRKARKGKLGEPLRGAVGDEVQGCVDNDHYAYLAEMVDKGVPARREYPRRRVKADPYPSAMEHTLRSSMRRLGRMQHGAYC